MKIPSFLILCVFNSYVYAQDVSTLFEQLDPLATDVALLKSRMPSPNLKSVL